MISVYGVHTLEDHSPLALGMCLAYAKQELPADLFNFSTTMISTEEDFIDIKQNNNSVDTKRNVFLFSNYIWNYQNNLRFSRIAKQTDPNCITIHGGPNTPEFTQPCEDFLRQQPHVDFAVANEGEETVKELLNAIAEGTEKEARVNGTRCLVDDVYVEAEPRENEPYPDKFTSPYLSGFFDDAPLGEWQAAILESYRGCPYQCTFCSWGFNSKLKLRRFDHDRVVAEINWIADHKIPVLWIADSNFGMFDEDVEITRMICEAKERTGFPNQVITSFAKNIKPRLFPIVKMLVNAKLQSCGILSLNSTDPHTQEVVRRSNIKTSEYRKLRQIFIDNKLPLVVEQMLALPGMTIESFKKDLYNDFDYPLGIVVHLSMLLVNSPMAEPEYKEKHKLVADEHYRMVSTATMPADDVKDAISLCRLFQCAHRFGILRYILRWLEWEHGLNPLDVLHDLIRFGKTKPKKKGVWFFRNDPYEQLRYFVGEAKLSFMEINQIYKNELAATHFKMRTFFRDEELWDKLFEQFVAWVKETYQVKDNAELGELIKAQVLVMPSVGRTFPETTRLGYDVSKWYADHLSGEGRALETYGPGTLTIEDPNGLCTRSEIGAHARELPGEHIWELESELYEIRRNRFK